MADTRTAGKRGRRQARHVHELMLARFRSPTAEPTPPESGAVAAGVDGWGMLGNDEHSDCVPAAVEHGRMAKASRASIEIAGAAVAGGDPEATAYTLNLYDGYLRAQGESIDSDPGVVIADYLQWGYALGLWEGFAWIDPRDPARLHQDMLDFGGVLLGVDLAPDAEQRFEQHVPWDVTATEQPDPNAGHGVWLIAYSPQGETVVTWGAEQQATIAYESGAVIEAWVVLTREDAERAGVDLAALQAEIERLMAASSGNAPDQQPAPPPPVPVVDPGTNSPRGAVGHTHTTLTRRVEDLFDTAHAEARQVLDKARAHVHALVIDALGPIEADEQVTGS